MRNRPTRAGFTLIELLVVLAIIATLAALLSAGIYYWISRQHEKNTSATIEQLYNVFKKQWDFVVREAGKEPIPERIKQLAGPDKSGNGQDSGSERAKVILIKLRLAEAFPQNYQDVIDYSNQNSPRFLYNFLPTRKYLPNYVSYLATKYKVASSDPNNLQEESGACLYMALTTSKGGASVNLDHLPTKSLVTSLGVGGPPGPPAFGDAWQKPIAFFRFPYNNLALAAVQPNLVNAQKQNYNDPLDPNRMLQSWVTSNDAVSFQGIFGKNVSNRTGFENIIQYEIGLFTAPTIVSAGRDNALDLTFVNASRGFPDMAPGTMAADDLYSFQLVAP